jgi:hypothetical protein
VHERGIVNIKRKKAVHIKLYTVRYKFLLQQGLKNNSEKRGTSKNYITFLAIKERERFQCSAGKR